MSSFAPRKIRSTQLSRSERRLSISARSLFGYDLLGWVAGILLLMHFSVLVYLAKTNFATTDEVAHLPAGISQIKFLRFDLYRVNPPLTRWIYGPVALPYADAFDWELYTPTVGKRPEFIIGARAMGQQGLDYAKMLFLPRIACFVFPLVGILALSKFTTAVAGRLQAFAVTVLWCFSLNMIGYSAWIIPDVAATAMGVCASYAYWKYLKNPTGQSVLISGACLGLALLSKLTWITALASFPLAAGLILWRFADAFPRKSITKRCVDLVLINIVGLFILNAGYLFEGSFTPLGDYEFCSDVLGGEGSEALATGNRFSDSWLGSVPVPLPKNYVLGIDFLKSEVEDKYWSFLNGQWKQGAWWYYYCITVLVKTPIGTLLAAIGGAVVLWFQRRAISADFKAAVALLAIPALVSFVSISLQGGFSHHHRYVLMIYPPMFLLASVMVGQMGRSDSIPRGVCSWRRWIGVLLIASSCISAVCVHPHYASYFNAIAGGPANGWRVLGKSNIEWGQDMLLIDAWIDEHPECRPLSFSLNFWAWNGSLFGLPYSYPPVLEKDAPLASVQTDEVQWWIVSVKKLYNLPGEPGLEYLQKMEPVDRIGYSFHVYRIPAKAEKPK